MNEEQAILDFFARTENLQLGLSVAEQMDGIRMQMNNRFWRELSESLERLNNEHMLAWQITLTGDKNAPDSLVGLYCTPHAEQLVFLRPMLEQQNLGGDWRIYFGLMWSEVPAPNQLNLPDVTALQTSLQKSGFKSNEHFLAWQWTNFHPRRKDFLLRYSQQQEKSLDDIETTFKALLITHGKAIEQANEALKTAPDSLIESLKRLRNELLE